MYETMSSPIALESPAGRSAGSSSPDTACRDGPTSAESARAISPQGTVGAPNVLAIANR
ncbi:hypothetical protein [Halostagnicola sp. A56]|uniref:hypothetical protein n=1 Tax=Halostagnicola sp. A56 TaxID=1495067 RepID=UPI0012E1B5F0|nr:hypothetical protein [Halostagnicola sp. A56]